MSRNAASWGLGLIGATAGGVLGYCAFLWLLDDQELYYSLILPGAILGLGCGMLSRHESTARGALCGMAALALGLFAEWRQIFAKDLLAQTEHPTPQLFLRHLHEYPVVLIMIIIGGMLAYWFGRGRFQLRRKPAEAAHNPGEGGA